MREAVYALIIGAWRKPGQGFTAYAGVEPRVLGRRITDAQSIEMPIYGYVSEWNLLGAF